MKSKIYAITAIIILSFVCLTSVASAYQASGHIWKSSKIKYYYDNYNSTRAKGFFSKGAKSWNATDVTFTYNASYNIYCTEVNKSNVEWDGMTSSYCKGNFFTRQTVYLNKAKKAWNYDGALKSVAVHEFGHCLGLKDASLGTKVIMNGYTWGSGSRYGEYKLTTPQNDDKKGANALY